MDCVTDGSRCAELLDPLRLKILSLAGEPVSATELGAKLGLPRQRVNYHVRRLARSGFLRRAGRRRRRNMIEQRYIASAQGYVLSPEMLGAIGADWRRVQDTASAAYLLGLTCQMQSDLVRAQREAARPGRRPTLSLKSQFRFESAEQLEQFGRSLREAVVGVIARHTSPRAASEAAAAPGRVYRLVLGCYPLVLQFPR